MIELIVFGLVLFIIAIGSTYLYDHTKAQKQKQVELKAAFKAARPPKPISKAKTKYTPFSDNSNDEEFLAKFSEHMAKTKSNKSKKVSFEQATSINSQLTVNELVAKLEAMKKKL